MKRLHIPLPPTFSFDEPSHTYRLDGRLLPGVTSIIRASGRMGNVDRCSDYSRERGTAVHRMLQLAQNDDLDESSLDARLLPFLTAWRSFVDATGYQPLLTEQAIYKPGPHEYAGTMDTVGLLGGNIVVIDVKSGSYPSWARLQLTAYMMALHANGIRPERGFGLQLKSDGKYRLHPYAYDAANRAEWAMVLKGVAV